MKTQQIVTVDSLAFRSIEAAKILSRHGIDFCTEGSRPFRDACAEADISPRKVLREILNAEQFRGTKPSDPSVIAIDELTRYIETFHHQFASENILFIRTCLSRLVRLHDRTYPELAEIKEVFDELTGLLTVHMQHEEFIVFPYIRQLVRKGKIARSSIYRSVNSPIPGMLMDHERGTDCLRKLKDLTHHFSPPAEGTAFRVTYNAMRALEQDLIEHLTLESEVLFPRAHEMEVRLSNAHWAHSDAFLYPAN